MQSLNKMFPERKREAERPLSLLFKAECLLCGFLYGWVMFQLIEGITR
jgi:hypothetical protein